MANIDRVATGDARPTRGGRPQPSAEASRWPRIVAALGAAGFVLTGLGAMLAPEAFYDAAATFPPYNQHLLQDIGAFNLGLGAALLLALRPRADALQVALAGGAVAATAHVASHAIGHDLGGTPLLDIPLFALTAVALAAAAWRRQRDMPSATAG